MQRMSATNDSSALSSSPAAAPAGAISRRRAAWLLGLGSGVAAGLMGFPLVRFFLYPLTAQAATKRRRLAYLAASPEPLQQVWWRLRRPWSGPAGATAAASAPASAVWTDLGPAAPLRALTAPKKLVIALETSDGWQTRVSHQAVYITHNPRGGLRVLSAVCPHLGCAVAWEAAKDDFHCPCHNSVFSADGAYESGPAPRGMDALPIRIVAGRLQVRYQYYRNLLPRKVRLS